MAGTERKGIQYALARVFSTVLQPLLMPLYGVLLILNANSYMALFLPPQTKMYIIITVLVCTLVVPALFIFLLNAIGMLEDLRMNNRKERILPLAVILLAYGLCAILIGRAPAPLALLAMAAGVVCIVIALIVTPFWKISLHMTGAGGVYALLLFLGMAESRDFTVYMMVATLLVGVLAWARLYLGRHTPAQVAAGFFGGFVASMIVIMLIRF